MKRVILIVIVIMMSFGAVACTSNTQSIFDETADVDEMADKPTEQPTEQPTDKPTQAPTQIPTEAPTEKPTDEPTSDIPDGAESVAVLFMSAQIDIFISMMIPEWTYSTEMIPGQVFFFPQDDLTGETGVAISSQEDEGAVIAVMWDNITTNFTEMMPGFEWQQEEDAIVGEYNASRYSFTSDWFYGDYFFWYTAEKLYICSFTAREDEYDELLVKLLESLETFEVLSEMQ